MSTLSSLDAFAGSFPFETFLPLNYCLTLVYNLINCYLSNARDRLFPCRFQIVHVSPTLSLHPKTRSSPFRFGFWSFFLPQKSSINLVPDVGEGRVIELDYVPRRNGSADIHIFRNYARYTSHRMQYFLVWISTCDFPLSGILHGDTFFI